MLKRKKSNKTPKLSLDPTFAESHRGRRGVNKSEIVGRAENYRDIFWDFSLNRKKKKYERDKPSKWAVALLAAENEREITCALDLSSTLVQAQFRSLIPLILKIMRERAFPQKQETKLDFLADSLAGRGDVTPRRSRDICAEHRARERHKSPHRILRREFYIECSCGYKGPARDNACRKCGAQISLLPEMLLGAQFT